jgi:regulatory protein
MQQSPRQRRPKPRLAAQALWEYAVKVLAMRAHSTGELRRKLVAKAELREDVDSTISRLRDYGYLSDRRFAESYAAARLENQGLGKSRVLRDLRQRAVASPLAEQAVGQIYREVDEMELIASFISRKVHTKEPLADALNDPKQLASAYRKLVRAGFTSSNVIRALKRIASRQDLLDSFEPPEEAEGE